MSAEDPATPPSHTSTNQWQSFEMRMRRRRAERCVMRAEVALEAGFPEDARVALEEARRLDCSTPDFEALAAAISPYTPPVAPRSAQRTPLALVATVVTVAAGSVWFWSGAEGPRATQTTPREAAQRQPAGDIHLTAPIRSTVGKPIITTEFVRPEVEGPTETRATKSNDAAPKAQLARLDPAVELGHVSTAAATSATPAEPLPRAPQPENPEPLRFVAGSASPPPAVPDAAASPTLSDAPAPVDERPNVRAALSRYEAGYSSLDVEGVQAVWPGVDARSLARAFDGLETQRISLGSCSIIVAAETAHAECHGTATWTPRIGGGSRTANRAWTFELRHAASAWHIVRVQAR